MRHVLVVVWTILSITVMAQAPGRESIAFLSHRDGVQELYMMDSDGRNLRRVGDLAAFGSIWYADWSPDGTRFVVVSGNDRVATVNADGAILRRFDVDAFSIGFPRWSPDSAAFSLFEYTERKPYGFYVLDADTGKSSFLAEAFTHGPAAWSPSGDRLIFGSRVPNVRFGRQADLYTIDRATGDVQRLTESDINSEYFPDWSRFDQYVLFKMHFPKNPDMAISYHSVLNLDTGEITQLSDVPQTHDPARWSPDGHRIAYGHFDEIHIMNADGSNLRQLTNHPGIDRSPMWFDPTLSASAAGKKPFTWGWLKSISQP
ncbi:MAG: hypothetical protein O3A46_13545 [Candidatus Poribacteria bacterium]|nr:hypothetical protein [Candidatus Poribacteria bacterium]